MKKNIKSIIRDLIPVRLQVPIKYWYCYFNRMLEPEMDYLEYLIPSGGHVIDIGGNRGIYTYKFNLLDLKIETFEPNPDCFTILKSWAHRKKQVTIHSTALSNASGLANLYIPIDNLGIEHDASATIESDGFENARNQEVHLEKLDFFKFTGIDFIKIDVEGHESSLIEGAQETLNINKPVLLIEIEQRHNKENITKIFERLFNLGYKGFFLKDAQVHDLKIFNINQFQPLDKIGNYGNYINNFFFLHSERINNGEYKKFLNLIAQN